jgi:hypothetical protein
MLCFYDDYQVFSFVGVPFMGQDHAFDVATGAASAIQSQNAVPQNNYNSTSATFVPPPANRPRPAQKIKPMRRSGREDRDRDMEIRDSDPTQDILREERMRLSEQMARDAAMIQHSQDPRARDEQFFLNMHSLRAKLNEIAYSNGLSGFSDGVCETLSLAVQEHIRTFMDQLVRLVFLFFGLLMRADQCFKMEAGSQK